MEAGDPVRETGARAADLGVGFPGEVNPSGVVAPPHVEMNNDVKNHRSAKAAFSESGQDYSAASALPRASEHIRQAGPWTEFHTAEGIPFFFNKDTNTSTWHRPEELPVPPSICPRCGAGYQEQYQMLAHYEDCRQSSSANTGTSSPARHSSPEQEQNRATQRVITQQGQQQHQAERDPQTTQGQHAAEAQHVEQEEQIEKMQVDTDQEKKDRGAKKNREKVEAKEMEEGQGGEGERQAKQQQQQQQQQHKDKQHAQSKRDASFAATGSQHVGHHSQAQPAQPQPLLEHDLATHETLRSLLLGMHVPVWERTKEELQRMSAASLDALPLVDMTRTAIQYRKRVVLEEEQCTEREKRRIKTQQRVMQAVERLASSSTAAASTAPPALSAADWLDVMDDVAFDLAEEDTVPSTRTLMRALRAKAAEYADEYDSGADGSSQVAKRTKLDT